MSRLPRNPAKILLPLRGRLAATHDLSPRQKEKYSTPAIRKQLKTSKSNKYRTAQVDITVPLSDFNQQTIETQPSEPKTIKPPEIIRQEPINSETPDNYGSWIIGFILLLILLLSIGKPF